MAAALAGASAWRVRNIMAAALIQACGWRVMVFSLVRGRRRPVTKKTDCRSNCYRPTAGLSMRKNVSRPAAGVATALRSVGGIAADRGLPAPALGGLRPAGLFRPVLAGGGHPVAGPAAAPRAGQPAGGARPPGRLARLRGEARPAVRPVGDPPAQRRSRAADPGRDGPAAAADRRQRAVRPDRGGLAPASGPPGPGLAT